MGLSRLYNRQLVLGWRDTRRNSLIVRVGPVCRQRRTSFALTTVRGAITGLRGTRCGIDNQVILEHLCVDLLPEPVRGPIAIPGVDFAISRRGGLPLRDL